jgi:hypothetical protein
MDVIELDIEDGKTRSAGHEAVRRTFVRIANIARASHYSSLYSGASATLLVSGLPDAPIEMERTAPRAGRRPKIPDRLRAAAPDHRNAALWRAGKVPGTVL